MCIKKMGPSAMGLVLVALLVGCGKTESASSPNSAGKNQQAQNDPVLSMHWVGMKRLSVEPKAAGFLRIWRLPESEKLKAQTLDKLALAPWRVFGTNQSAAGTNYAQLLQQNHQASSLRPLLEDLVQEECYLDIRGSQASSAQVALAVHLDAKPAAVWETNLARVFGTAPNAYSKVGSSGTNGGWRLQFTNNIGATQLVRQTQLARAGEWTVVGIGTSQNAAFTELLTRAQRNQLPAAEPSTKDWLQTSFDLRQLAKTLDWGWDLPDEWPRVSLNFNGDGTNILSSGQLVFNKPLPFQIENWNIPTNLIREPLHSFAAAQGLQPWLSSLPFWKSLNAGHAPNQLFTWAQSPAPFLGYSASPLTDAKNVMAKLGPRIIDSMNPMLATNRSGKWEVATNFNGVVWRAPIVAPVVESLVLPEGNFLFAGWSSLALTNGPPPAGTIKALLDHSNVVYFAREITGPRIEAWMFLSQLGRIIFRRAQLTGDTGAIAWLRAAGPLLDGSITIVTKTNPTTLYVERKSSIGLTALELHLLADWLESPRFPCELHSRVVRLPPFPVRGNGSNPGSKGRN
jgi:hypothetical protein